MQGFSSQFSGIVFGDGGKSEYLKWIGELIVLPEAIIFRRRVCGLNLDMLSVA